MSQAALMRYLIASSPTLSAFISRLPLRYIDIDDFGMLFADANSDGVRFKYESSSFNLDAGLSLIVLLLRVTQS